MGPNIRETVPMEYDWFISPGQNGRHIGERQFQTHILEVKLQNSDSNFTEFGSQESDWQ